MLAKRKWAGVFSWITAVFITASSFAVHVTEPAGAAHGYPGLCDINGKKLADAEFRQWADNDHLNVVITARAQRRSLHYSSGDSADREIICECARHKNLADKSCTSRLSSVGRSDRITDRSARSCGFAFGSEEWAGSSFRRKK
jgi:hypothetical protein